MESKQEIKFVHQLVSILIFAGIVLYGFFIRPVILKVDGFPIEIIMVVGCFITIVYLMIFAKVKWQTIEKEAVARIGQAIPIFLILITIGVLISGLIMGGTLPMMIYYGIKIINPKMIYAVAFILPCIFSVLTGTAWGSAATVGVVLMSIGTTIGANLFIVAGAVVGGSFFGDKLSPISDSTNIAAIAAKVPLYDHVKSMLWTTTPAALIAVIFYGICGFIYPAANTNINSPEIQNALTTLSSAFSFNILTLVPLLIVLYGSFKQKPPVPVMISGAFTGFLLAGTIQNFTFENIIMSIGNGFNRGMVTWADVSNGGVIYGFIERGGLWTLAGLITTVMLILTFISILTSIDAMNALVQRLFKNVKTRFQLVFSTLFAGTVVMALTSNGVGTSFILGDVFGPMYDRLKVSRKVLSRSCEDSGTLIDPLLPWSPSGVFLAGTLGVSVVDYAPWAVMNYITIFIAIIIAYFGIGCFLNEKAPLAEDTINAELSTEQ